MQFLSQVKLTPGVFIFYFLFLFLVPISYVSTTAVMAIRAERIHDMHFYFMARIQAECVETRRSEYLLCKEYPPIKAKDFIEVLTLTF
jgi:hypothetical protein